MGKKVEEYKGFEIWLYDENEVSPQAVYGIKGKEEMPDIPGYRKSEKAIKKLIDKTIKCGPIQVDIYEQVPILFDFGTRRFHASMQYGDSTIETKSRRKEKVIDWINKNTI